MESKERIIAAAIEVFAQKGKHGARMEEIAAHAKVNKAMLYYFFTTRENLYTEALASILYPVMQHIHNAVHKEITDKSDPVEIVKVVIESHFDAFKRNDNHTKIIVEALTTGMDDIKKAIQLISSEHFKKECPLGGPEKMINFIQEGINNKVFRKISPPHLLISMVAMNILYLFALPLAKGLIELNIPDEQQFLKEVKENMIDILINGIAEKRNA